MTQIAAYIGWSERRTQWLVTSGRLPIKRVGQSIIARKSELDRFLSARGADEAVS